MNELKGMGNSRMAARFAGTVEAQRPVRPRFLVKSRWDIECLDREGNLKFTDSVDNVCTIEGLNKLLDVMFHGVTQITDWYLVIFENDYTPVEAGSYAVPGYTESVAYDELTRPVFTETAASAKSMSNSASKATYTMNASKTLYGSALVGGGTAAATKGDTAGGGVLYAAAKYTSAKPVDAGDTFKVTCTLTASDVV